MRRTIAWLTAVASISAGAALLFPATPGIAQSFSVRDLECHARAVTACVLKAYRDSCRGASIRIGNCDTMEIPASRDRAKVEACAANIELNEPELCLVKVDLGAILSEMRETNRAIREDQRAMLNQICRSLSAQPDRCDETIPAKK